MDRLTSEDLTRWRLVYWRKRALELNPAVFSKEETLDVVRGQTMLMAEFEQTYGLAEVEWEVDAVNGDLVASE